MTWRARICHRGGADRHRRALLMGQFSTVNALPKRLRGQ
jgi:hypothetical protein